MHQMVPTIYYFFWVRYYPNKIYSQKKSRQETKYRPPFPPTTKPHPLNPFNHGPTSVVLAGYRLVVPRPFCVCLPRHFCRSKLALFCSAAWLYYFFTHFMLCFVISFGLTLPLGVFAANTSCCSLFLSPCFFILVFTSIFYTKGFGPL